MKKELIMKFFKKITAFITVFILTLTPISVIANEQESPFFLTRAEFVALLIDRFSEDRGSSHHFFNTAATYNFADVATDHEFYNQMLIAKGEGLIASTNALNHINPNALITGAEAATMLNNILNFDPALVSYSTELALPARSIGAANVLLDLQMVPHELIASHALTTTQANIFIDAIECATMFLDSPFTLTQARPQDNLWMYFHRAFLANAAVSEYVVSQGNNINAPGFESIWQYLLEADHTPGSYYYRAVEFFNMLMDTENVLAGLQELDQMFDGLRAANNIEELIEGATKLAPYFAIQPFFKVSIDTDILLGNSYWSAIVGLSYAGMWSYDAYTDEENIEAQDAHIDFLAAILGIFGESADLHERARAMFKLEQYIYSQMGNDDDYEWNQELITLEELHALTPNSRFFTHNQELLSVLEDKNIFLFPYTIGWIAAVDSIFVDENLDTLVDFAKLSFAYNTLDLSVYDFINLSTVHISGGIGYDFIDAWQETVGKIVREQFSAMFNQLYIDHYANEEVREYVLQMSEDLRALWSVRLDYIDWLSPATVAEARAKLYAMVFEVSHPENGFEFSIPEFYSMHQGGNFAQVIKSNARLQNQSMINRALAPVDISANMWRMINPNTFNAMYHRTLNAMVIPMGYLVYPNFDINMSREFNLGAIGTTIGHEILHGFDDGGVDFDAQGIKRNWWTDADRAAFNERTQALSSAISSFFWVDNYLDGNQFLTETIADLGGLSVVFALAMQEDLDMREVIYASVRQWGFRGDLDTARRYFYGVHPPSLFRANFNLTMFDIFHEIFDTSPGDGMYLPQEDRIVIW